MNGNERQETSRRFTEDEMRTARETSLPDLLEHLGYQVRQLGNFYTTKEMDSLRIKAGEPERWFRYSSKQHGDAITFLQEFRGMKFPEAVRYLLDWNGKARDSPARPIQRAEASRRTEKAEFHLPEACETQKRVFAYLRKRGIAAQVINGFIDGNLLYEDAQYHNCVFVGRNQDGKPVFASKRSTYDLNGKAFKGDVAGSDKSVAFRLFCDPKTDWVVVFEAPIDMMSFCTINRNVTCNAVALCGLYDGPLETYLKENPHLRRIVLCLDTDQPGREATEQLKEKYGQRGYSVSVRRPEKGKDWNEYLQQRNAARQRAR